MLNTLVFEDGILIHNSIDNVVWDGFFSKVVPNGPLIKYIQSCLPKNSLLVIPKSDGNINRCKDNKYHDVDWNTQIQPYIDYAKQKDKIFIVGTLAQIDEEEDIHYLYLPLDDGFFEIGIQYFIHKNNLPSWESRTSELCWRGGCSGVGGNQSLRVKFVEKIFHDNQHTNIRLSHYWSEGKNIPIEYFAERIYYTEFFNYKIFFIVDGNVIASNHMYSFSSGCIPFLISNANSWFSNLIKPYVHYIPVQYDLSDLMEQIEWVKNNDNEAKRISENALLFAETYFSSDYQKKYIKERIDNICRIKAMENMDNIDNMDNMDNKIIDCFTFYNEIDLLFYRLTLLNDVVDKFVIVESNQTHAGNKKILYYETNKYLFKKFEDKIVHIVVDLPYLAPNIDYSKNEQWINEHFQRNSIDLGIKTFSLNTFSLNKKDLIIVSDLDEIVDPKTLYYLKKDIIKTNEGFSCLQDMYYYNLNTKHEEKWKECKVVTYETYLQMTPQEIRECKVFPLLKYGGWHLSYFGNKEFIQNKIKEFGHQEYNDPFYTDEKTIEEKIEKKIDLFNRHYVPIQYIESFENYYLPTFHDKYLLNYIKQEKTDNIPIYVYFHVCCIHNWREIVSNILFKIKNSGLYQKIKEIKCVVLGDDNNDPLLKDPKINIVFHSLDISLYEKKAINLLFQHSIQCDEEFRVLYIHSKGVTDLYKNSPNNKNVYDWVEYLCYFNLYYHTMCLNDLNHYDAVGVNLQEKENVCALHYSGNFWWSKSSHIRKLHEIHDHYYNSPEFWIASTNGIYKSLWNSDINHYNEPYPCFLYENKKIDPITIKK